MTPSRHPIDVHARAQELSASWLDRASRFRVRARQIARELLGQVDHATCAPWFELVASEFLSVQQERISVATLLSQVAWAAAWVAERAPAGDDLVFPGETPEPYWSVWPSRGQPPFLVRDHRSVRCPEQPAWEAPPYDTSAWVAMYQLLVRMTHIGDFATMDLYPVPGIDPPILAAEQATIDFQCGSSEVRPPMGLAVAAMLLRQQAFLYASEFGEYQIAGWLFCTMSGTPPAHEVRVPVWASESLRQGLAALDPGTMLAACEAAALDLDQLYDAS